ncbi:MAG: universal stress protein [Planctomycetota bacterium]
MCVKRVLVGLGLEACAETATKYALEIAERFNAELTGVTLIDTPALTHTGPTPIGAGAYAQKLSSDRTANAFRVASRLAKRFRQSCTTSRRPFELRCEEGDPLESLISIARYHDLAVLGRDGLFEHGVMDEPLDGLVRLVSAGVRPIFVVPPDYRPIRRVVVAYSGSMESAKTLRRFMQFRAWPEAEVLLVHFAARHHAAAGEELLRDAADYCHAHGVAAETDLQIDSPRDALLPYAESVGADTVVIGNSARRLMLRRLFGETMLRVVREAELPLFLCQ